MRSDAMAAQEARRASAWIIPVMLGASALFLMAGHLLSRDIQDLLQLAPVVRTIPAGILILAALPLTIAIPAGLVAKSIPAPKALRIISRCTNGLAMAGVFLMFLGVPAVTAAQYHWLPRLGYEQCNILAGHPSMYFNDWVRNPAWCVRGKDRAWILEQARIHP